MAKISLTDRFQNYANITNEERAVIETIVNGGQFKSLEIAEKTGIDPEQLKDKIIPNIVSKLGFGPIKGAGFTNTMPRKILMKTLAQGALNIEISPEEADLIRSLNNNHKTILRSLANGYKNSEITDIIGSTDPQSVAVILNRINKIVGTNSPNLSAAIMRAVDVHDIRNETSDFDNKPFSVTQINQLCIKQLEIIGLD